MLNYVKTNVVSDISLCFIDRRVSLGLESCSGDCSRGRLLCFASLPVKHTKDRWVLE